MDNTNTTSETSNTLALNGRAAKVYALKLGWRTLPARGKIPLLKDWVNAASSDPEVIEAWFRQYPNANVGIATGDAFFVLDIDPRNGGRESLAALEAEHGALPTTVEQATPSGGTHLLFKSVPGLSNTASKLGAGLDIRAAGGQFIVAPSKTPVGAYRWVRPPWDMAIAEASEWLLTRLTRPPALPVSSQTATFPPATQEVLARASAALDRHGPAIEGQGGDVHAFIAAAILMNDYALTSDEAWSLFAVWNKTCQPPWEDEYELAAKLHGAEKYARGPYGAKRAEFDSRPIVQLFAGKLSEIVTEAEAGLIAAGVPVYTRGSTLVRPVTEEVDAAHGKRTTVARLARLDATYTRDLLSRHVRFHRFNAKSKEWLSADPPADVAQTLLCRDGEWGFPAIAGIVTTQTMRPNGSILFDPGFDPATRLLLVSPPAMPPIPEPPMRADAEQAIAMLEGLLTEFPFENDASRSVVLSAILTTVARGAFSVAPGHAASASTPGSGKSFLWDVVSTICSGQPCPVLAAGRTEEESEKRLGAALLSGQVLVSIDNISGGLGGDALSQLIERPIVEVRVLGKSELVRVETRSTVLATGNNLQLLADVTRRFLLATLDANLERPELRQFRSNPVATVLANRGRYVAAALTVVRAYAAAGRPHLAPRLASFEGWSDTVRSALMWLGRADPCLTMERARSEDPLLALQRSVFATWFERFGPERVTAAEVLLAATTDHNSSLAEAVLAVASNHGRSDVRTFGKWLSRHKGRITLDLRLHGEADANGHSARWWVEKCGSRG